MSTSLACLTVAADGADRADRLREQYSQAARKYSFHLDADRKGPLTLEPAPIFHWESDNDWSGDVFVWTAKGRPQVVGCILSAPGQPERPAYHEFHTLAAGPLAPAEMSAKYRWAPGAGVAFRKLDGAPAATPAARLAQMRSLTREMHAFMEADGKWELRLLPQPLYRYQPKDGDVIDGAIFSWVWSRGTDPELLVVVECLKTPAGLEWRYAPARFSNRELWLKLGDREVWRAAFHNTEQGDLSTNVYTTRPAGKIAAPVAKAAP